MVKAIIAGFIALLITASVCYYQFLYPPTLLKHKAQHVLNEFSATVDTKDRARIGQALGNLLNDSAKIRLEVSFYTLSQPTGSPLMAQDFDKQSFLAFVDNILYSLDSYGLTPQIQNCEPDKQQRNNARLTLTSSEWAEGKSYYSGVSMNTRFSTETTCEGGVAFMNNALTINALTCKIKLLSLPKEGEERKIIRAVE